MKSLSFTQYLESKNQLREAIKRDPIRVATYVVTKYCRIPVGKTKQLREYHDLKPKQIVKITWRYKSVDEVPEPINIEIPHIFESEGQQSKFATFQTGERLQKWLRTNAREVKE